MFHIKRIGNQVGNYNTKQKEFYVPNNTIISNYRQEKTTIKG